MCYEEAKKIINEHMDVLHRCAELLIEKERITREEFEALFDTVPVAEA
jgi:cell division protease FtsH